MVQDSLGSKTLLAACHIVVVTVIKPLIVHHALGSITLLTARHPHIVIEPLVVHHALGSITLLSVHHPHIVIEPLVVHHALGSITLLSVHHPHIIVALIIHHPWWNIPLLSSHIVVALIVHHCLGGITLPLSTDEGLSLRGPTVALAGYLLLLFGCVGRRGA
ncbi:hypothetical protein AGDE_13188 [Angomonas deanei]|nr:hypothetical protein AGDE_13188 [Angomonas deanei]|eukprot:EPY22572.1 hypothetical protein AGDE_13188 [Angomonas deanei]